MIAEIICVGSELLLGNIVNTNARFLAEKCAEYGLSLYHQQVVGDNDERLRDVFLQALSRSDVVITSGGLGPTNDDLTKEVICNSLGLEMMEDKASMDAMKAYFKKLGRSDISPINNKQALIPKGGKALINKNGTAPAVMIETNNTSAKEKFPDKVIFLLPGPPRELIPITEEYITPFFKNTSNEIIKSITLKLTGIGESSAASKIKDLLENSINPTVAPYAKMNEVHLRITAKAKNEEEAVSMIKPLYESIKKELGKYIYSVDENETIEEVVIKLAKEKGYTISVAESCTAGLLCARLVNVQGASNCINEGYITYSNDSKIKNLGVKKSTIDEYGAVSAECAREMAIGTLKKANADISVSITGIAGPDGGSKDKPVGLVYIAVSEADYCESYKFTFAGNRQIVREAAASKALELLWRKLK